MSDQKNSINTSSVTDGSADSNNKNQNINIDEGSRRIICGVLVVLVIFIGFSLLELAIMILGSLLLLSAFIKKPKGRSSH